MRIYQVSAAAGFACAALLVVNAARRGGFLPETAFTHAIAPFAALTGLFAIVGIYLLIRDSAGGLGIAGFVLNAAGLAGAFAVEYILHFVFPYLDRPVVTGLLAATTGRAFLVTSVILILGVLVFSAAAIRSRAIDVPAVVLYAAGMMPGSLRNLVPEPVYLGGLVIAAIGVAWMARRLWLTERDVPALAPAV